MERTGFALLMAIVVSGAEVSHELVKLGRESQLVRWLLAGDVRFVYEVGGFALMGFVLTWVLDPLGRRARRRSDRGSS